MHSLFSVGLTSGQSAVSKETTFIEGKAHHSQFAFAGQFIILVIDSTARDRLLTTL